LAENAYFNDDRNIFTLLTRYRHCTGFDGVMELPMTPRGSNMNPAVFFDYSDNVAHSQYDTTVAMPSRFDANYAQSYLTSIRRSHLDVHCSCGTTNNRCHIEFVAKGVVVSEAEWTHNKILTQADSYLNEEDEDRLTTKISWPQPGLTTKVRAGYEGGKVTRSTNLKRLHNFEVLAH
jgi:hypothetical protein